MGWMDWKYYNFFDLLKGYKFIKIFYKLKVREREVLKMKKKSLNWIINYDMENKYMFIFDCIIENIF